MQQAKIDVYEIVRDRVIKQLEAGVVPWRRPWSSAVPTNAVSKKAYRGINLFLLPSDYSDNRWLTYKQAQELGGNVKKGEHGSIVVFWKMLSVEEKNESKGRLDKKTIPLLRYYTVFNVEQCENLTKLAAAAEHIEFQPEEAAEAIIAEMPNAPTIRHSGDRAFYNPASDSITLPPKKSFSGPSEYYSTAFHELTHSTGHATRTGRHADVNFAFGCEDYSKEELVAEFGAAFLCAQAGVDNAATLSNSASYISSWLRALKTADKRIIVSAASKATKAAAYILEGSEQASSDGEASGGDLEVAA